MQREISHVKDDFIRHNPDAIAASIIQLICDDLKFKDMQNDTQYVMLNDKLKNAKKSIKTVSKAEKAQKAAKSKHQKEDNSKKSKFYKKYEERIASIKESELKLKQKEAKNKNRKK